MTDRRALAFAAIAALWLLGLELLGGAAAIAYLAPALLIFLPLLGGRYPGDEALLRAAAARRASGRAPRQSAGARPRHSAPRLLPRGGRLVGAALAGRGPPARAAG